LILVGHRVGNPGVTDLGFGAHEPLRDRRQGRHNARAISSVVSPQIVRSVSATWTSGASAGGNT